MNIYVCVMCFAQLSLGDFVEIEISVTFVNFCHGQQCVCIVLCMQDSTEICNGTYYILSFLGLLCCVQSSQVSDQKVKAFLLPTSLLAFVVVLFCA